MRRYASRAAMVVGAVLLLASQAAAQTVARVGIIPVLGVAPILVVDKEGWGKDAGFSFKFSTFESGPVMIQAPASPASKFVSDPRVIVDATAKMQAFQVSIGTLDKDVPLDGLFDPSFYIRAAGK